MQFTIRFYNRYPLDLRDRWEIHRMTVTAETKEQAKQDASNPEIEIIDVEKVPEPVQLCHTRFDFNSIGE